MATRQVHTYCAMCISRCGVVATVEDGRLTRVTADPDHPNGCICIKGTAAPEIVYSPDRLRYPLVRTRPKGDPDPGWARISWDEALGLTASRLLDIRARYGPEAVAIGYATPSATASGDFQVWLQRLANVFGTPNLLTPVHICNWNRHYGAEFTYGGGTPSPDYDNARCILLWGFNPRASWPAAAARISQARQRGAKLIAIDPRRSGVAEQADAWLRVRPGADGVLAMSMIHVLLAEGLYDAAFVHAWTNGAFLVREDTNRLLTAQDLAVGGDAETCFVWDDGPDEGRGGLVGYHPDRGYAREAVTAALAGTYTCTLAAGGTVAVRPALAVLRDQAVRYAPERTEGRTGVPASEVRRAVRLFVGERPSCYYSWAGIEQHRDAAQINRAICLFYTLTGQFDRRGSNVYFAEVPTNPVAGRGLLPPERAARRLGLRERPLGPPSNPGHVAAYDLYRAILSGQPYPIRALVTFGSDLLLGHGDPVRGRAALAALDFYVHVDVVANPTAALADLVLPASTCWERDGLLTGFPVGESAATWVQLREPPIAPLHESRPDLEIVFDLARRLGLADHFFDGDIEAARDYQLAPSGLTVRQLRAAPRGLPVDAATRHAKHAERDPATGQPRGFPTPTRKLEIYSTLLAGAGYDPLPAFPEPTEWPPGQSRASQPSHGQPGDATEAQPYPLTLTFARVIQFCDEQHRHVPRLRRAVPAPFVEIHPTTAADLGVSDREWVVLETVQGRVRLRAKLNPSLDSMVVSTQYGWWQGCQALGLPGYDPLGSDSANANLLIPNDEIDPISGSVPHRSQRCRVRKEECAAPPASR